LFGLFTAPTALAARFSTERASTLGALYGVAKEQAQRRARARLVGMLGGDATLGSFAALGAEALGRANGLGRVATEAARQGDFSVLMALCLLGTLGALVFGLLSDWGLVASHVRFARLIGRGARA
jgi:ABC-type dipeptide/oligopeptide/nickel transport system permease component